MSTASLPLPVGARTGPTSRSVAQAWAAPRAADLVLDPWAAPVGPPIAQLLLSPWPAPDPAMRLVTMPPPVALSPVPDLSRQTASLAESTDAALAAMTAAALRTSVPVVAPAESAPTAVAAPAAGHRSRPGPSTARLRARLWALVAGSAAAAAGVVTLIASAL